jgi:SAM-dependent methyltransferase
VIVGSDTPALRSELVEAIHRNRLSSWAETSAIGSPDDGERDRVAALVKATCQRIRTSNDGERDRLLRLLGDAGVSVIAVSVSDQRHTLEIDVAPADAPGATAALLGDGFASSCSFARGALESMWRTGDSQVLTRDGTATTVVQLRWRQPRSGRLQRLFGPSRADWDAVELPTWLWWGYPIVRPLRIVAERLGLRSDDHSALEPFLVTPRSLIEPLLDVASVGADDVVFDFGSGDGRFVVAAATARGCRSIGVEQSPELCAVAVQRASDASVADRVRIVNGDAAEIDLSEVTVVVLFLPMVVAARVVDDLRTRLRPGARIVLHEQSSLAHSITRPDAVHAVIVDDAVTVAHRWNVTD